MAAKATRGTGAQFTYDFGIAIAQSTVQKIERLTGVTLTLASAYYAVQRTAKEYIQTLRQNTGFYGGILQTMLAMEQAQNRLIKGQSYFSSEDQLAGMRQLQSAGVNVAKNMEWINKSAHAMGKSYSEFAGAISSAIAGNMGALVDMGLITQRATRMFEKYQANTIMRESAIINFLKKHKGLQNAIANDFETIQDQTRRFSEITKSFFRGIIGYPNDPTSLYGSITMALKAVTDAFAKNKVLIENVAFFIGQVLTRVVKTVSKVVLWLGRQVKKVADFLGFTSDKFVEKFRSFEVWLEFWKAHISTFFKKYKTEIIIAAALLSAVLLRIVRKDFVMFMAMGNGVFKSLGKAIMALIRGPFVFLGNAFRGLIGVVSGVLKAIVRLVIMHPVIGLIIAGILLLYKKCEGFRKVVNYIIGTAVEGVKFVWNLLNVAYLGFRVMLREIGQWFGRFFNNLKEKFSAATKWISDMWNTFMNTKVGQWLKDKIFDPVKKFFKETLPNFFKNLDIFGWLRNKNEALSQGINQLGAETGIKTAAIGSDLTKSQDEILSRDYLSFGKNTNPILDTKNTSSTLTPTTENQSATMNFGDIVIKVEGGRFDENKLAQKIKEVVLDLQRQGAIRAGA